MTSDTFRGFFALPVREDDKPALVEAARRMKPECSRLDARFIVPEQLHITLKFLGHIPREHIPRLVEIAKRRAAEHAAFDTHWNGVIAFGGVRRARTLVVAVDDAGIVKLANEIEADVEPLGIERETRDFRPHVSLARIKRPGNAERALEAAKLESLHAHFDELRLYESRLTPAGGIYSVLASFPLGTM